MGYRADVSPSTDRLRTQTPVWCRMRLVLILALCGCGASASSLPVEATTEEPEPASLPVASTETIEAWLETVRLASSEVPLSAVTPPQSFRERSGDGLTTWTSVDGLSVIVRYDYGVYVVARAYAEPPPEGIRPRMVPALHGASWPHFVMLVDGSDFAVPMHELGVRAWRPPLQPAGVGSLDETARLSHISDWESDGPGVMAYGAPAELEALERRDTPSGQTIGRASYDSVDPENPQWEPMDAREIFEVDERIQIQVAPLEHGDLTRIVLNHGGQATPAFRLDERNHLEEFNFYEGRVLPVDGKLLVHFTVQGWGHYFSWHDAETGERIGDPAAVKSVGGDSHGRPPGIKPIISQGEIAGYVLGRRLVVEELNQPGRYTPSCEESPRPPWRPGPDADDYEEPPFLSPTIFRLVTTRGVRCLLEERFD